MLVQPMFEGPVDVVGDVHGEFAALSALLAMLGYNARGEHPEGRRLVFVGDLCDRGEDSAGVLRFVADLAGRGLAQMTLGNHEMNTLRRDRKSGSEWFFDSDGRPREAEFGDVLEFLKELPLVLERPDLRVVHAAWVESAIAQVRTEQVDALTAFERHERQVKERSMALGLEAGARREMQEWGPQLEDRHAQVPMLDAVGTLDEYIQIGNPIRVLTSGVERRARRPFFASGKWRFVDRVPWWEAYADPVPVVFGHYWRWWELESQEKLSKGEPSLFTGVGPEEWLPTARGRQAMCVDYGVGARVKERAAGKSAPFETRLGALRFPERQLVTERGD
jgi:hypothetical protein